MVDEWTAGSVEMSSHLIGSVDSWAFNLERLTGVKVDSFRNHIIE
jgi:hypothetical protein